MLQFSLFLVHRGPDKAQRHPTAGPGDRQHAYRTKEAQNFPQTPGHWGLVHVSALGSKLGQIGAAGKAKLDQSLDTARQAGAGVAQAGAMSKLLFTQYVLAPFSLTLSIAAALHACDPALG